MHPTITSRALKPLLNSPCTTARAMAAPAVALTAPNGRSYSQPIGLFINNEWVPSSDGGKITSINPT